MIAPELLLFTATLKYLRNLWKLFNIQKVCGHKMKTWSKDVLLVAHNLAKPIRRKMCFNGPVIVICTLVQGGNGGLCSKGKKKKQQQCKYIYLKWQSKSEYYRSRQEVLLHKMKWLIQNLECSGNSQWVMGGRWGLSYPFPCQMMWQPWQGCCTTGKVCVLCLGCLKLSWVCSKLASN